MTGNTTARLTLGPLLFHWSAQRRRDFYFRIADESPFDTVYLGEVVCSKRETQYESHLEQVAERLRAAGKEVVMSTLALVISEREVEAIRALADTGVLIEANDVAAVQLLGGRPHVVGPYINVFHEGACTYMVGQGAVRIVLPVELPLRSVQRIAAVAGDAGIEVQVFGRQPLSVAMRCYHARSHNLSKDHCQLVCGLDADGLTASTIDGVEVLTINGTQTLSHGQGVLLADLAALRAAGVSHFRLSPHALDMVRVGQLYREVLDGRLEPAAAAAALRPMTGELPWVNGFLHGREGASWVQAS
jgi:O2-independent ubiquinone biosynthesis protein UbiV